MNAPVTSTTAPVLRASATRTRPKPGEVRNGDASIILERADGLLVVVIDALGHGATASDVAARALAAVQATAAGTDVVAVIGAIHAALKGTRGAAATACTVANGRVRAAGVGNVTLRAQGLSMVLTPGILGSRHAQLQVAEAALSAGARLVFFSDGVAANADVAGVRALEVERAADVLFDKHAGTSDDATLVVVELT